MSAKIYRLSEARFERQQSREMAQTPWEERAKAIEPMWKSCVSAAIIVACFFMFLLEVGK